MMKKILIVVICILIMFSNLSYADYFIDTSNSIIDVRDENLNGYIKNTYTSAIYTPTNFIYEEDIIKALEELKFDFNGDYTIHIADYSLYNGNVLGMALPENTIILFDFLPFRADRIYQHTLIHELGHLVYMNMAVEQQEQYKILRGIPTECDNYPKTNYVNRPQEIFAEDFRLLFGGEDASLVMHFNQELENPKDVKGLKRFIRQFGKEGDK